MVKKSKCCVPNCDKLVLSTHRFPIYYEEVYNIWIERIAHNKLVQMHPLIVHKNYTVCDKHFSEECKIPNSKKLKLYSLPTLYLPGSSNEYSSFAFPTSSNSEHDCGPSTLRDEFAAVAETAMAEVHHTPAEDIISTPCKKRRRTCSTELDKLNTTDIPAETLEELKCSNCKVYLSRGPVYLQHDGAGVCRRCYTPKCPATRNTQYEAMAKLLQFPCKNQKLGCPEMVPFVDETGVIEHEDVCEHQQYACPVLGSASCDWLGTRSGILSHCRNQHPDHVLENPCTLTHNIVKTNLQTYIITAFHLLFLLHTKVCVATRKICHSVRFLGKSREAASFIFNLDIKRGYKQLSKQGQVEPQGCLALQEPTSVAVNTNSLLEVLGGSDDITFTVTVKQGVSDATKSSGEVNCFSQKPEVQPRFTVTVKQRVSDTTDSSREVNCISEKKMRTSRQYCSVPGCQISSKANPEATFFNFPLTEHLLHDWVVNTQCSDLLSKSLSARRYYKVCYAHFEDSCFQTHEKKKLNRGAVPKINLPGNLDLSEKTVVEFPVPEPSVKELTTSEGSFDPVVGPSGIHLDTPPTVSAKAWKSMETSTTTKIINMALTRLVGQKKSRHPVYICGAAVSPGARPCFITNDVGSTWKVKKDQCECRLIHGAAGTSICRLELNDSQFISGYTYIPVSSERLKEFCSVIPPPDTNAPPRRM